MGELLQTGRYERKARTGGQMVTQENPSNPLEAMEEGQDKVPNDKAVQPSEMESTGIGQLPKRNLESSAHAEPDSNQERNSPPRIHNLDGLL